MTLLCYDHHENVKQIEIESDSDSSSEGESDLESDVEDDHELIVQNGDSVKSDAVKWTFGLVPTQYYCLNLRLVCALLAVGVALVVAAFILT